MAKCKVIMFGVEKDIRNDYKFLLRDILSVQGMEGVGDYNDYNRGVQNGLECALALLEEREPNYRQNLDSDWCPAFQYAVSFFCS